MTGHLHGVVDRRRRLKRLMTAPAGTASCLRCTSDLDRCPSCSGRFAYPRLCQTCRVGLVCPSCERTWALR
jgi:hypothetical protein